MSRWIAPVVGLIAHGSALRAGFVWLDHAHLEERRAIAEPSRWPELFTHGFAGTGYYRPLTALSLSIDALVHLPLVYHAMNLVWHAAAALLTTFAAEALGLPRRAATIAGVLFAVHPLGSLVASAIAFRSESMLATFLLLFVWAFLRGRPIVAAVGLGLACLTKETGFALGALFLGALALEHRGRARIVASASGLAVALAMRLVWAPPWRASHASLGAGQAIGTRLAALFESARAILLPFDRHVCDAFPVTEIGAPAALAGALVLGGAAWLAWRRRGIALLLALALLPSLQLVPVTRWWSPHYVYVALAFVAMLAAERVDRLGRRAPLAIGGAALLLGAVSFLEGRRYASDATLWRPEVAARPSCREGHFYLGEVAREARAWASAASHYEAALAVDPAVLAFVDRRAALQNLGAVRLEQGLPDEARASFRRALDGTGDPDARRELTHDLALATLAAGDAAEAARLLEAETARADAHPASLALRATALEELGRSDEASALRARVSSSR